MKRVFSTLVRDILVISFQILESRESFLQET